MAFPTQNLEVVKQGLALLIEQYKESPIFQELIKSYLQQIQDLQDASWEVIRERYLENAEGVQLDVLGSIVGLRREGLNDTLYRQALELQILINRSFGVQFDVLTVARVLLGPSYPKILYAEYSPATIKLTLTAGITPDESFTLFRGLFDVKAAGVKMFVVITNDDENAFTFNDAAGTLGNTPAKGFGSVHGATTNGKLAHVAVVGA